LKVKLGEVTNQRAPLLRGVAARSRCRTAGREVLGHRGTVGQTYLLLRLREVAIHNTNRRGEEQLGVCRVTMPGAGHSGP
jgi:hypothetical protein